MLISILGNKIVNTEGYKEYRSKGITVYYSGLVFVRGRKMGPESLDCIIRSYKMGKILFRKIFGSFAIILIDGERITIFSDNSNMHGILVSQQFIGSNIAEMGARTKAKFNDKSVCEYLVFHRPILSDSLVDGISKLDSDKYILLSGGGIEYRNKNIGTVASPSTIKNPKKFFEDMVYATKDYKTIAALTGGYDSRLIVAAYNYYGHADCFISGDNPNGEDIKCSRKAAAMGGIPWKQIIPPMPQIDADTLVHNIYREGGYKVEINTSGYRINYFMSQLNGSYDILLTGDAGDMHKDFWDTRKIPFYPRGIQANMRRLADKYFITIDNRKYLGSNLKDVFNHLKKETYESFEAMKKQTVIKSCLSAGWRDWIPVGLRYTQETSPMQYSPLQEFELVKYSYGIAPKGKRMNMFHRRLITGYNKSMSKEKTIYRTTCSDKLSDVCIDVFRLAKYYIELVLKYMERKVFHTNTRVNENVNRMNLSSIIRRSKIAAKSVSWAKEKGYLAKKYTIHSLPEDILRKIIYLYLLNQDIKSRKI